MIIPYCTLPDLLKITIITIQLLVNLKVILQDSCNNSIDPIHHSVNPLLIKIPHYDFLDFGVDIGKPALI